MYKLALIFLLSTSYIFSNINAIVSIVPEHTFLKKIGGKYVNIALMVQAGNSPHTYEPKPSQMIAISKANLYFAIGVEFEHVWLPKFQNLNKQMQTVDISKHIQKIPMQNPHHTHKKESHKEDDPHIWTSPSNVKIIAQNMYNALVTSDTKNEVYYKANLETFLRLIDKTDTKIKQTLSHLKGERTFMVFHPSWGYFAKEYNLTQMVVEIEGKSPKPKELVKLIKEAKTAKVKAIFTQPEFSDNAAKIIANELHIPVVKVSPMAKNWSENLINIAKHIVGTNE
jgi:zinc transport system substrate-binding protein